MEFRFQTSHHDLEATIHAAIAALAAERGVTVKQTRLELNAPNPHIADFRLILTVKAMIVSAEIVARGRAEIIDAGARIAEIEIEGEGMVAGIAKSAIEPQLAKVRGKTYPIADLQLPGLTVRDVALSVGSDIALVIRLEPVA